MRIGLRGIAIALLLTGCAEYDCGDDLDYSPREHRCVCPEGFAETDGGVCITVDAGPLACPGDAEAISVYDDADGDGYGRPDTEHLACPDTPGTATNADDCDDACATCYPGATEVCDGRDNDCTSGADDTFACVQGTATACETTCGSTGTATCANDCTLPATCTPPAETCNSADDDCDGLTDEGVLAFSDAIDWTAVQSSVFDLERYGDGFVVTRIGPTGVEAQLLDRNGTLTGSLVTLVASTSVSALDATVVGETLYVAYGAHTTAPAGELRILGASLPDLTVREGPRTIGSPAELPDELHLEHSFYFMVFYVANGLRMRSGSDLTTSSFTERLVVTGSVDKYDIVGGDGAAGRAFVAYTKTPTGETDSEIFVQAVGISGADGEPQRITDDLVDDDFPRIAHSGDRVGVIWTQAADDASIGGNLRLATGRPTASGWIDRAEIAITSIEWFLRSYQLTARADGWLVFASDFDQVSETSAISAFVVSDDATMVGTAAPPHAYEQFVSALMTPPRTTASGSTLFPVVLVHGDTGSFEGRLLACDP